MSAPVLFLLGAVALSLLGGMVVWLLNRPRKERFGASIDTFNRDLSALAPPGSERQRVRPGPRSPERPNGVRPNAGQAPGPRPQPGPRPRPGGPASGGN